MPADDAGDGFPDSPCERVERWLAGDAVGVLYEVEATAAASSAAAYTMGIGTDGRMSLGAHQCWRRELSPLLQSERPR